MLPDVSGNHIREFVFKRKFKNLVKMTDMNNIKAEFKKYEGMEVGIHGGDTLHGVT